MSEAESKSDETSSSDKRPPSLPTRHFLETFEPSELISSVLKSQMTEKVSMLSGGDPSIKVVIRRDWSASKEGSSKIALISGGGSGHEPSHAGFVGKGMLTAAVCGNVFASPSTDAILTAIQSVCGIKGCLLIVKNYTGDVLNFRLAAEMARAQGLSVEMCVVNDDVSLDRNAVKKAGRRGVCGTVFIHKILGYLCEQSLVSLDLSRLKMIADHLCDSGSIGTIGIAARECRKPGVISAGIDSSTSSSRIGSDEFELGMGIHGEPGHSLIPATKLSELLPLLLAPLFDFDPKSRNYCPFLNHTISDSDTNPIPIALLLNNLGSVTDIEMSCIQQSLLFHFNKCYPNVMINRVFCGRFMTALDMHGFSVSLINLNCLNGIIDGVTCLDALDAAVSPRAWIPACYFGIKMKPTPIIITDSDTTSTMMMISDDDDLTLSSSISHTRMNDEMSAMMRRCIENVCISLSKHSIELDRLDSIVGDGDCGSTLAEACSLLLSEMKSGVIRMDDMVQCLLGISRCVAKVGGSSGALYGYLFASSANILRQQSDIAKESKSLSFALTRDCLLKCACNAIWKLSEYSGASKGDRTMMDALIPVAEGLESGKSLSECAECSKSGAESTKDLMAKFGRTSYLSESVQKQAVDPGALAVSIWVNVLAECLE